jgi:hypothetical protein
MWIVAALALLSAAAIWRGVWLDEFWSLILSDPAQPNSTMLRRWANDTHPFLPNMLYNAVLSLEPGSIGWQRLILNIPAYLLFVAGTFVLLRRTQGPRSFHVITLILIIALPAFAAGFTEFRTYAWQLCAAGLLVQLVHYLASGGGALRPDALSRAVGALTVIVATNLHFIGGLIASVPIGLLLLFLHRRRAWTWFYTLGGAAGLGWALMVIQAAIQIPNVRQNIDVSWIGTSTLDALAMFGAAIGAVLIANPVAALFAFLDRDKRGPQERDFLLIIATALIGSAGLLLTFNAFRPILIDRYLVSWQALLAGAVAALSCRAIAAKRLRSWLFGTVAALACLAASIHYAQNAGWAATRDYLAATVRQCPETKVFAMNPWRVAAPGSRVGAYEGETFAYGYERLARQAGFGMAMLPEEMVVLPVDPGCPTLLWVENAGPDNHPRDVLRAARLLVPPGTRLGMFKGHGGFVLVAIRPRPDGGDLADRPGVD